MVKERHELSLKKEYESSRNLLVFGGDEEASGGDEEEFVGGHHVRVKTTVEEVGRHVSRRALHSYPLRHSKLSRNTKGKQSE